MSVDASVQALIDASLKPVADRVTALESADSAQATVNVVLHSTLDDLIARVTALEAGTVVVPPPVVPPVVTGVPVPDPTLGKVLRKVFTDGALAPFQVLTYPDSHIGSSGQWMTVFTRFANGAKHASVHDGYLDLQCVKHPTDGLWDGVLVGTSQAGNGPTFGYGITRTWARFNVGPGTWQTVWQYDTTSWSADEIDFIEMLDNLSATYHVLGTGTGSKYGLVLPKDIATAFHEFKTERRAGFTAFSIDGVEVGRVTAAQSTKKLALMLDSKVGFGWTGSSGQITAQTPSPAFLHIAAVTVDA